MSVLNQYLLNLSAFVFFVSSIHFFRHGMKTWPKSPRGTLRNAFGNTIPREATSIERSTSSSLPSRREPLSDHALGGQPRTASRNEIVRGRETLLPLQQQLLQQRAVWPLYSGEKKICEVSALKLQSFSSGCVDCLA